MKVLVQRVKSATVTSDGEQLGKINKGLLLYICLEQDDTQKTVLKSVNKILKLRIFEDEQNKMNLSIQDVKGELLSISQFTLSWDGKKGHRPSFEGSMPPAQARLFYALFNTELKKYCKTEEGRFGADMKVESVNDGPVTFFLEF